ncbi:sigma-70 family RNA polymerase sigma factor [Streptomyces sp. NPDC059787]|uniref:sigma-70 family RNA polymerase sigma factor n=1 Tax=Streptomyces sp. NPDC059787 TaxID=3346947 RepID=UPI0036496A2B
MRTREGEIQADAAKVRAAADGDRQALDSLVAAYLPLVYNIVGRAMDGHADVDDVVQETLLRAVNNLHALREPDRFRSWLVAIAVRQVRDWAQARRTRPQPGLPDDTVAQADPQADFADLTILRLELSGQRREAVEATRWLEEADRETLSLWWMEAAGQLTRSDWAAADGLDPHQAAVRVGRVKERLQSARSVLRALAAKPRCPELAQSLPTWDGRPSARWRKRLSRHVRDCPVCARASDRMIPVEGLLGGLALVPLPLGMSAQLILGTLTGSGGAASSATTTGSSPSTVAGQAGQTLARLTNAPMAVVASSILVLSGAGLWYGFAGPSDSRTPVATPARSAVAAPAPPTPSPSSPQPSAASTTPSASPTTAPTTASPSPSVSGVLGPHALRAAAQPNKYIGISEGQAVMVKAPDAASLTARQLIFTVTPGLMGTGCYSFRHANGSYLRHTGYHEGAVELGANDNSALFRADATFCLRKGAIAGTKALFAFNSPLSHLRYRDDGELWLEPSQNADPSYGSSTSFQFVAP